MEGDETEAGREAGVRRSYIFRNATQQEMIVWVEMWCDELSVPPGSSLTLHCESERGPHPPTIEPVEGGIRFWPECDTYTPELDGQPLLV